MEVIFIKDLKNQGKAGQIKNVKDGYAENFLIKKSYDVKKNNENLEKLNNKKKKKAKEEEQNKKEDEKLKKELTKETLEIKEKEDEKDKV